MANLGWIALHREITENWLWQDKEPFDKRAAWIDLLLMVNHENKKILFDGNLVEVKRGQRITSIRQLCDRWKWSNTKVKKFLENLEKDGMISLKITPQKATLLTIENYAKYQDVNISKNDTETSVRHQSNDSETSVRHLNNNDITMINNDNNDDDIECSSSYQNFLYEKLNSQTKNKLSSSRFKSLIKKFGEDKIVLLNEELTKSDWLRNNLIWNIKDEFLTKILEGEYRDFKKSKKKYTSATEKYSKEELEEIARNKMLEAAKKFKKMER